MVPFILNAPINNSSGRPDLTANDNQSSASCPFDLAMDRALAKNSDQPAAEKGPQPDLHKPARQRMGSRSSANPTNSANRTSSQRKTAVPTNAKDGLPARADASKNEESPSPAEPGKTLILASDASLIQPQVAPAPCILSLPPAPAAPAAPASNSAEREGAPAPRPSNEASQIQARDANPATASAAAPAEADPEQAAAPRPDGPAAPDVSGLAPELGTPLTNADQPVTPTAASAAALDPPGSTPGNEFPQPLGTSAAQTELLMKKAEKVPETADLSEQNLPGQRTVAAGQAETRVAEPPLSMHFVDSARLAAASANVPDNLNDSQAAASTAISTSSSDDARLRSLERTHDLVAMHALHMTRSGNETLRVVIEPGAGTRLSLELRFSNGGIEAQALLHRGDFEFLNGHWAELQQRLESRGVHLAALEYPTSSTTDQRHSQQAGRRFGDEPPTRSAFAELALDGSMKDSPAARPGRLRTYDGWETWA